MKVAFDTPLTYTDGNPIAAADLASATYTVYVDTVSPPVKGYTVPAANLNAATPNADGSKHVVVDVVKDLKVSLSPGKYFVSGQDSVSGQTSSQTGVVTYTYSPTPNPPTNFSVA